MDECKPLDVGCISRTYYAHNCACDKCCTGSLNGVRFDVFLTCSSGSDDQLEAASSASMASTGAAAFIGIVAMHVIA